MNQSVGRVGSTYSIGGLKVYLYSLYTGAILFFLGIVKFNIGMEASGVVMGGAGLILLITATIIVLIRLFQIWRFVIGILPSMGLQSSMLTPGRAVGYLFIPFFNLYWVFIALGRLPKELNTMAHTSDIQSRISSRLGFAIAILSVASIIPIFGQLTGMINALILTPILLTESVRLTREVISKRSSSEPISMTEETPETRNLPDLFRTDKYSVRRSAGLAFPIAKLAATLFLALAFVPSIFPFHGRFLFFTVGQVIIGIITGVLFVIICSTIRKTWLLPFAWGLAAVPIGFITQYINMYFSLTVEQQERAITSFGFRALPISFLWGFLFMGALVLAVRYWGLKPWSLITGLLIFQLLYRLPEWLIHPQGFLNFSPITLTFRVLPIVEFSVLGGLLYCALRPSGAQGGVDGGKQRV